MRFLLIALGSCIILTCSALSGEEPARRLDAPPQGTTLIEWGGLCGTLSSPWDGDYEAAIAWAGVGLSSPLGGAFAQRFMFPDTVEICSIDLDLTQIGGQNSQSCDIYIWHGSSGVPSSVVFVRSVTPGSIAVWPWISRHTFQVDACVTGETWIGYWANWPGADEGWYVAAEVGEDSGASLTYVAAGVGDRTGWQPVSSAWDRIAAIGIGVESDPASCAITPIKEGSWG